MANEDDKAKMLNEATALLMNIALKGEANQNDVERAVDFLSKVSRTKTFDVLPYEQAA